MLKKFSVICLVSFLSACGGGSDTSTSNVEAPDSISGLAFRHTILNGNGLFPTQGEYIGTLASTGNTYVITGDGVNVSNSAGTYTYLKNGSIGTIDAVDSIISTGTTCEYTFLTVGSGNYSCTAVNSAQNGTFTSF